MQYSTKEIYEVPCIECGAVPGSACTEAFGSSILTLVEPHEQRAKLRKRMPSLEAIGLDSTDKSLICYYAFVMLCDSCSASSIKLFSKQFSSVDIQKAFAHKAIEELRKDGLLGSKDSATQPPTSSRQDSMQVRPNGKRMRLQGRNKTN